MPRSIKDRINKSVEENKRHIAYGDYDFIIAKTTFPVKNSLSEYETMILQKDITEDGWVVRPKFINGLGYNRKPYISASLDLFDIIRGLSKKAYILFVYIIRNINMHSNKIILSPKDIADIIDEKHYSNVNKIVNELIKSNIICRSDNEIERNVFAINHNEYFKGNFTKFINMYNNIYNNGECSNREDVND